MQLQSLLVVIALLGHLVLFADGRAIEIARQDTSIKSVRHDVYSPPSIEPRVFKNIKNKIDQQLEKVKDKVKGKDKQQGEASGSVDPPPPPPPPKTLPPPPKYEGKAPLGMTEGDELEAWNKFLEMDLSKGKNPPEDGAYLMYSGANLRTEDSREPFKFQMEARGKGKLYDWVDTYKDTEAQRMWRDYIKKHEETRHIVSYALSWGQARRAANDRADLTILYENKNEPMMRENTFWGAVEAGIITGPDSKVERIWRYNDDEVRRDPTVEPVLMWDRSVHEPFGKTDNDWKKNPRDPDVKENPMMEPRPLGSPPAGQPADAPTGQPADTPAPAT